MTSWHYLLFAKCSVSGLNMIINTLWEPDCINLIIDTVFVHEQTSISWIIMIYILYQADICIYIYIYIYIFTQIIIHMHIFIRCFVMSYYVIPYEHHITTHHIVPHHIAKSNWYTLAWLRLFGPPSPRASRDTAGAPSAYVALWCVYICPTVSFACFLSCFLRIVALMALFVVKSCLFMSLTRSGSYLRGVNSPNMQANPRNFDPKDVSLWAINL